MVSNNYLDILEAEGRGHGIRYHLSVLVYVQEEG